MAPYQRENGKPPFISEDMDESSVDKLAETLR
jgi:hypothetical protein